MHSGLTSEANRPYCCGTWLLSCLRTLARSDRVRVERKVRPGAYLVEGLAFLNEFRFQAHGPESIDLAIDIVIAFY